MRYEVQIDNQTTYRSGMGFSYCLLRWPIVKFTNSYVKNLAVFRPLRPSDGLTDQVPYGMKIGKVKGYRVTIVIPNVDSSFVVTKLWFSTDGSGTAN
jgi:hypothetical protein